MTTTSAPLTTTPPVGGALAVASDNAQKRLTSPWASLAAVVLAVLWTLPTFGLLISSIRPERKIKTTGWWTWFTDPQFTLEHYKAVLSTEEGTGLGNQFINSFVITIPAVIIPLCLAALAAYAFAWIDFPGRGFWFVAVFALQIVPIQVTLIPLLTLYVDTGVKGSGRSGSRTRSSPCRWPSSCCTTS
jgi:alpha-glucoside transport system permease protein